MPRGDSQSFPGGENTFSIACGFCPVSHANGRLPTLQGPGIFLVAKGLSLDKRQGVWLAPSAGSVTNLPQNLGTCPLSLAEAPVLP